MQMLGTSAFLGSLTMMTFVQLTSAYALSLLGIAQMAFTISFSIFQYRKPIVAYHFVGGVLFLCGLLLRSYAQRQKQVKQK